MKNEEPDSGRNSRNSIIPGHITDGTGLSTRSTSDHLIDFADMLHYCLGIARSIKEDRGITYNLRLQPGLGHVRGDRDLLQYVFLNILLSTHTRLKGGRALVTLKAERDRISGKIHVEILGIPLERCIATASSEDPLSETQGLNSHEVPFHTLLKTFGGRFGIQTTLSGRITILIELPSAPNDKQNTPSIPSERIPSVPQCTSLA